MSRAKASDPTTSVEELRNLASQYPKEVGGNPNATAPLLRFLITQHGGLTVSVAKAILKNPALSLICLEDPAEGMWITGEVLAEIYRAELIRGLKSLSGHQCVEFGLICVERVYPLWDQTHPNDAHMREILDAIRAWIEKPSPSTEEAIEDLINNSSRRGGIYPAFNAVKAAGYLGRTVVAWTNVAMDVEIAIGYASDAMGYAVNSNQYWEDLVSSPVKSKEMGWQVAQLRQFLKNKKRGK